MRRRGWGEDPSEAGGLDEAEGEPAEISAPMEEEAVRGGSARAVLREPDADAYSVRPRREAGRAALSLRSEAQDRLPVYSAESAPLGHCLARVSPG